MQQREMQLFPQIHDSYLDPAVHANVCVTPFRETDQINDPAPSRGD